MSDIISELENFCKDKKLKRSDIAKLSGKKNGTITRVFSKTSDPGIGLFQLIADAVGFKIVLIPKTRNCTCRMLGNVLVNEGGCKLSKEQHGF